MLRYLLLCMLIAPQALAAAGLSPVCHYQWFQCESNSTSPFDCKSDTHPGWIPRSQLCEGTEHCIDGSDESIRTCKTHHTEVENSNEFYFCTNGGIIQKDKTCDNNTDCSDGSDEMRCGDFDLKDYRGKCGESMVKCKRQNKCISIDKVCDNEYDCNDGWDESLSMCFETCDFGQFQCGNGACIEGNLVCDSKPDCLDAADELPNVCIDIPNYIPMPNINCTIPHLNRLIYIDDETAAHVKGEEKYFLPHEIVRLRCPTFRKPVGLLWNVCKTNGKWQFPLLQCMSRKNKN